LRRRLKLVQQARAEDLEAATTAYRAMGLEAELNPLFGDMPARYDWAHLVVCGSGASSVTELAASGRPALMIPLPNSIDDHQMANAQSIAGEGGGWVMSESAFTTENVAERLASILSDEAGLARAATAARAAARVDAAERLADLVLGLVPGKVVH